MGKGVFGYLPLLSTEHTFPPPSSFDFLKPQASIRSSRFSFCSYSDPHPHTSVLLETNKLILFFEGIITNKRSLFSTLNLDTQPTPGDFELLMLSYEKWQTTLGQYIQGNFQLILWDKKQEQLFSINSPFSNNPFYYHFSHKGFYFTNFFPLLKQALNKVELNPKAIANHLIANFIQRPDDINITCYKDIVRLPPGYSLILKNDILDIKPFSHYSPRSSPFNSREETVSAFRECFTNAVKDYLPTQGLTGSHLSGGLDSSSVSLIAAQLIRDKQQNLTCFGVIPNTTLDFPARKHWNVNDECLMQAAARQAGNIKLQLITCNKPAMKLTNLAKFCYHFCESPASNVMNMTWIASILYAASQQNIDTLLNGYMGNLTASFKGQRYSNPVLRTLAKLKKIFLATKKNVFDSSLINPLALSKYQLIQPDLSAWYDLNFQTSFSALKLQHLPTYDMARALQLYFNIKEYDPTTHPEVINFCLSLPNDLYYYKGVSRYLIRESMRGILPEAIRLNTRRGTQCASWFYQLKEALPYYQALLPKFKKHDLIQELIDVKQMEALMGELSLYDPFKHDFMQTYFKFNIKLVKGLHVAEWILLHEEPQPWEFNPIL